jgi:hypothetical protein
LEANFPVQNKSLGKTKKMTGLLKELKYPADIKGVCLFLTEVVIHT